MVSCGISQHFFDHGTSLCLVALVVSGGANAADSAGRFVGTEAPGPAAGRCPADSSRAWSGRPVKRSNMLPQNIPKFCKGYPIVSMSLVTLVYVNPCR